jgi:hypothetical protein
MTALPVNSLPLYWLRLALGERARGVKRTVVATIGDGSFQYSVQAIWTAAQHRLPVVFVVMRNYGEKPQACPGWICPASISPPSQQVSGAGQSMSTAPPKRFSHTHAISSPLTCTVRILIFKIEWKVSNASKVAVLKPCFSSVPNWIEHPDFTRTDDPLRLDPLILLARIPQLGMLGRVR